MSRGFLRLLFRSVSIQRPCRTCWGLVLLCIASATLGLAVAGRVLADADSGDSGESGELIELRLTEALIHYDTTARQDPSGIEAKDALLALHATDGRWTHSQLTSPNVALQRRLLVQDLNTAGLKWDGRVLSGSVAAKLGRFNAHLDTGEGENMHSMLKAHRRTVINWHLGGRHRVEPAPATLSLDARLLPGHQAMELQLDAFAGDTRPATAPPATAEAEGDTAQPEAALDDVDAEDHAIAPLPGRQPLLLSLERDWRGWALAEGRTPTWNRALHELDTSGLTVEGNRLSGTLRVTLMPDPWVPGRNRKGQRTRDIVCLIDATFSDGKVVGTYNAAGDQGKYTGSLTGQSWRVLAGSYTLQDTDGLRTGQVRGRSRQRTDTDAIAVTPPPDTTPAIQPPPQPPPHAQPAPHAHGIYTNPARQYTDANPPLHWDLTRGHNIAWRSAVGQGWSVPVIEGDRVFVTVEPDTLVCLDRNTGQELWRQRCVLDADAPPQQASATTRRHTGPTPIVTQGRVYAVFGHGVAACFDLDGRAIWTQPTGLFIGGEPTHSPILCEGVLICPGEGPRDKATQQTPAHIVAIDAATGKVLWRRADLLDDWPGIAVMRLSAPAGPRDVLLTPRGTALDLRDGSTMGATPLSVVTHNPPIVEHDTAYFVAQRFGQAAVRYWMDADGKLRTHTRWEVRRAGSSSMQQTDQGLVYDGLLYLPRSADESAGHHPVPWDQLDVYDASNGQHLARPNPVIINTATPLPLVRAGAYIVQSDEGRRSWGDAKPNGSIAFLSGGDRPYLVARHELPDRKLDAPPVFFGRYMLLRSGDELICIGSDDPAQHRAALEHIARFALAEIGPEPNTPSRPVPPLANFSPEDTTPLSVLLPGIPPESWLMAGPMPLIEAPDTLGIDWAAASVASLGQTIEVAGRSARFEPLPPSAVVLAGSAQVVRSEGIYYRATRHIDVGLAIDKAEPSSTYFFTVLRATRPMTLQLDTGAAKAWVAGEAVVPGEALELVAGDYPLLVRVDIARFPPVGRVTLAVVPRVRASAEATRAAWLDRIRIRRDLLHTAAATFGERGVGLQATRLLQALP